MKVCLICKKEYKPTSNYQKYCKKCAPEAKKRRARKWYLKNVEHVKQKSRKQYYTNYEQNLMKRAEYRQTQEYKECAKEYSREYAQLEENKERIRISQRKYAHSKKGRKKRIMYRERYRERRQQAGDARRSRLDDSFVDNIFAVFDNKCFKCHSKEDLTLDHHIPLISGGVLDYSNTVLLCRKCNSGKRDRAPSDFYSCEELEAIGKIFGVLNALDQGRDVMSAISDIVI